mmetsp:Transcript_29211/g.53811  ORF Transcript_29211/g.53811 Transcript_29211/m.53811 type:complete len:344 (+) Transcript_29211:46-1077(+)
MVVKRSTQSQKVIKKKVIKLGEICCGWMSGSQALSRMRFPHKVVFAADKDKHVKQLAEDNFEVGTWYDDAFDKKLQREKQVDVLLAGFPCQPYSAAGKGGGMSDARGEVILPIAKYINTRFPKSFVLENVKNFGSAAHAEDRTCIFKKLNKNRRYTIKYGILDSQNYSLPQHRERMYIVGIRNDLKGHDNFNFDEVKKEGSGKVGISAILDKCPPHGKGVKLTKTKTFRRNINKAKAKLRKLRRSPADKKHWIVDVGAGRGCNLKQNVLPTITASRGASQAFYNMKLQRCLTVPELMRAQGALPQSLKWTNVSETQMGKIVGNAMSIPVVRAVLKNLLKALRQ